jgi:hypothetical protein
MRRARAATRLPGRVGEAEALWYDRSRWAGWIDGFAAIRSEEGRWPEPGSAIVWDSRPQGRGRVVERVASYEPRRGQVLEVEDSQLRGTQTVAWEPRDDESFDMSLELVYELKAGGPMRAVTDLLFIRRALTDSLRRTLDRFAAELATERELAGQYPPAPSQENDHR